MTVIRLLMVTSQLVNANSASINCCALTPTGALLSISTSSEVKSLMDFTFSLPFATASSMELVSDSVVVPGGSSLMTTVDSSFSLIFARTFTLPLPS